MASICLSAKRVGGLLNDALMRHSAMHRQHHVVNDMSHALMLTLGTVLGPEARVGSGAL